MFKSNKFNAPPFCIIPSVTTSFTFQFYILQVVATLKDPAKLRQGETMIEARSRAAHKVGYATVISVGVVYLMIFGIGYLGSYNVYDLVDKKTTPYYGGIKLVRNVMMSIFGSDGEYYGKKMLIFAHLGIISQLICHMPFIYFIGKEHIL
jgi:hypothetical protein